MSREYRRRTFDEPEDPTPSPSRSPSMASAREGRTGGYWKQNLYLLQERAPKPRAVFCGVPPSNRPKYYGPEFHGLIDREETEQLLAAAGEGAYLVRESQRSAGAYTLCMRFDGKALNYKLFFDGQHFVGEKRFDSMDDLVADGLISMYVDKHAADYIKRMADEAVYEESPYIQYQKSIGTQRRQQRPPLPTLNGATPTADQLRARHGSESSQWSSSEQNDAPQKAHRFIAHTFRIPHYCDYCRNFMWGLVQQGLRCDDCGFAAHKRCSERSLLDCRPDLKYVKRMFAVDLTTLCMAHSVLVPPVVEQCIMEVQRRGLNAEGIYRISGSHEEIEKLRQSFDMCGTLNQRVDLSQARVEDIHSVAGLLKLYFRLLPQPLVTFSVYREMAQALRATRNEYDRIKTTRKAVEEMPPAHVQTLKLLLEHLNVVATNSSANKMTLENLATIFSPTVLCTGSPQQGIILPQQEQYVLHFLLVHYKKIFGPQR
uniref:N-chimaerin n=2 Tax=Plectus sambesii TaxID=2011161 RepID=A0A914UX35_9BILA